MPLKYSHVKKRSTPNTPRKGNKNAIYYSGDAHRNPNPHLDRSITQAMTAVSELERAIARILLIRYEQDIARLYSARLHNVALMYLPKLIIDCVNLASPGWIAANAESDEIKDFFRGAIAMDMRQAGERVATKSVLWSYTALRHFAMSNNVHICKKKGLHSLRLLPHFGALKAHLNSLEALPIASFQKPTHLPSLDEGLELLENDLEDKRDPRKAAWDDWRYKLRIGYERLVDTLWAVSKEFDVRGYGIILREKLTTKWCDCGCSTDHLGEVCERTVREDEEDSGIRPGKEREWDGRGSGIYGWQTDEEEDVWEMDLDFGGMDPEECDNIDQEMTIGELIEWRYFKAEKAKESGNKSFRKGDYVRAIERYSAAHETEPELPHYQLNIAAAHLKLSNWIAAEKACDLALNQHKSSKGYWRRAKARRMMGRKSEALKDLRAVLRMQPNNVEASTELKSLMSVEEAELLSKDTPALSSKDTNASEPQDLPCDPGTSTGSSTLSSSSTFAGCSVQRKRAKRANSSADASTLGLSSIVPWPLAEEDTSKLRITTLPIQVEMPVMGESGSKLDNIEIRVETYSYPTWERCRAQRVYKR